MKRTLTVLIAAVLPATAMAARESYTLDPTHTYPNFMVEHWGLSMMYGRFDRTSGKFSFDRAARTGAVEVTIETASLTTGDADKGNRPRSRDEHLRQADFFNVAEFPRITFKSTNVKFSGDNPVEVEGQITLLGTTKPLTIKIDRWVCKDHPVYKKPSCGGNGSAVVKRSEFGMKYAIPNISDEVRLTTLIVAFRE